MQNKKEIPTLIGVVIIVVAIAVLFGGVFAYQYFATKTTIQPQAQNQQQNQVIQSDSHDSNHVYPKETTVTGKDNFTGEAFTKTIVWPEFRNVNDSEVLAKINQTLSFNNVTGYDINNSEFTANAGGLTNVDYLINYDKNNVLNITFINDFMGAYPSEDKENYSINLTTGESVMPSDIFSQNKISGLLDVLNLKLQDNIQKELTIAKGLNPTNLDNGACSEQGVNDSLQQGKDVDPNYGKFTEDNMTGYKITSSGMEFIYNFDFAHVVKACEPENTIVLTYNQLKDYIRPDGLLGGEIK